MAVSLGPLNHGPGEHFDCETPRVTRDVEHRVSTQVCRYPVTEPREECVRAGDHLAIHFTNAIDPGTSVARPAAHWRRGRTRPARIIGILRELRRSTRK